MTMRTYARFGRMLALTGLAAMVAAVPFRAEASSHREAPGITAHPQVDGTDFYMFRSYEPGREDYVTLVANYIPLQDPYGGPNYFAAQDKALYEIHIDNDGDAVEDITFQFRFQQTLKDIQLPVGPAGQEMMVSIPLKNLTPFGLGDTTGLNVTERYTVSMVRGDRRSGVSTSISKVGGDGNFTKPADNIGVKSIPDYPAYANQFKYDIVLPGTPDIGRVFVGQRKDPFVVNLGETFDLINTNPLGPRDGEADDLADKNVLSFCLELPISFLTDTSSVIGGWTSASLRQARVLNPFPASGLNNTSVEGGAWTQVSRLGSPLVNEVVIGLKDKDRFNASEPKDDAQFLKYVTNPTLPELIEILFGVQAPDVFPRDDLIQIFLTGVPGLNDTATASEMLRLNTATPVTPFGSQSDLGVIGGDLAGFPNGRRPGDDSVDIALRAVMGVLLGPTLAPDGALPYTDGALVTDQQFDNAFPYLTTPIPGSPN